MSEEEAHRVLAETTAWVDAVLALGCRSVDEDRRRDARTLADQLKAIGFARLASALEEAAGERTEPAKLARLCVVLDWTRESWDLERWARPRP